MEKKDIDLSKIFKSDWDFQNNEDLIKNLYNSEATHTDTWDRIFQECLKQAIVSKNTKDIIASNENLAKSQKIIWISGIIFAWVWLFATIIFWIIPLFK